MINKLKKYDNYKFDKFGIISSSSQSIKFCVNTIKELIKNLINELKNKENEKYYDLYKPFVIFYYTISNSLFKEITETFTREKLIMHSKKIGEIVNVDKNIQKKIYERLINLR